MHYDLEAEQIRFDYIWEWRNMCPITNEQIAKAIESYENPVFSVDLTNGEGA